jgi:hypothetical protein
MLYANDNWDDIFDWHVKNTPWCVVETIEKYIQEYKE